MTENNIANRDSSKKLLNRRNKIFISLVGGLIGLLLYILGFYLNHLQPPHPLGEVSEEIGKFLFLIVALHFAYEFLARDFDREEYIDSLKSELKPLLEISETTDQTIKDLFEHTKLVLNLVSYADSNSFESQWKNMIDQYEKFWLIGNVPLKYLDAIASDRERKKKISIYRTVDTGNRDEIKEAMNRFSREGAIDFKAFHISRFDWGFTIIASNQQESDVQVLLNYNSSPNEEPTGYYMIKETALALHNSIGKRLSGEASGVSEGEGALYIESEEMLEYIIGNRFNYLQKLMEAKQGILLENDEQICKQMENILGKTHQTLEVTHIAEGRSIELLDTPTFKKWLEENYAAADRGVKITRIFLIEKNEIDRETQEIKTSILRNCVKQLKDHKITVKYRFLEDVEKTLLEDFSIYDGRDLVYISPKSGGSWGKQRTEARHTCTEGLINKYKEIFNQLDKDAKEFQV